MKGYFGLDEQKVESQANPFQNITSSYRQAKGQSGFILLGGNLDSSLLEYRVSVLGDENG